MTSQLTQVVFFSFYSRPDWADDVSEPDLSDPSALPAPVTTTNKDGTKTTISYRLDENGRRIKTTRKTRTTIHRERVNPAVAERRSWAKFGMEKGKPKGPQPDTTSIAENMQFRPSVNWKAVQAEEAKSGANVSMEEKARKDALKDKKVKCRICSGEHFTARCPFKDTMAPVEEGGPAVDPLADEEDKQAAGGLGSGGGGYVPPHLRKGGAAVGGGERMGGKYERDDLATLRVTNVGSTHSTPPGKGGFGFVFLLTISQPGVRNGRGARLAGYVRAVWPSDASLPRQRQGHRPCQGLRLHILRGPRRRGESLREDGRFWVSPSDPESRVRKEDYIEKEDNVTRQGTVIISPEQSHGLGRLVLNVCIFTGRRTERFSSTIIPFHRPHT